MTHLVYRELIGFVIKNDNINQGQKSTWSKMDKHKNKTSTIDYSCGSFYVIQNVDQAGLSVPYSKLALVVEVVGLIFFFLFF